MENNHSSIEIDVENIFTDLAIIDSDLEGKEIFFTGEVHGVKANSALEIKFIKYFKEKTDFTYYLCETAYSDAYFYNKYLDTGDVKILEEMYRPLKGTFEWNKDSYNLWKELYEYNKTLSDGKKIKVVGVDIEHQIDNAYRYLVDVLPKNEPPEEIKESISKIKSILEEFDEATAHENSSKLLRDIEEKESLYKGYLGENFFGFKLVNQNILNSLKSYERDNDDDWNNTRDKFIYENFKAVEQEFPKGKYYGQWGLNHIYQAKEENVMWFGSYLNSQESEFKDKILSIAYIYDDCKQMGRKNNNRDNSNKYTEEKLNTILKPIKQANDQIGEDINIYKLTGEGSSFFELQFYDLFESKDSQAKAADFFQYIICIKNSEASKPLNDEY